MNVQILRHIFVKDDYNIFLRDDGINQNISSFNVFIPYTEITYITDKDYLKHQERITDIYDVEEISKINKRCKLEKQFILRN